MADNNITNGKQTAGFGSFLKGTILASPVVIRQFRFMVFMVILALVLITNRYRSEKVLREIETLQDTIDDLRSRSITNSARLMHMSKPSEVVHKVDAAGLGLKEQVRAPGKVVVHKMKKK